MKMYAVALFAALTLTAGCGGASAGDAQKATVDATVIVDLRYPFIDKALDTESDAPEQCAGAHDYSQIVTGSVVTFRNANSTIVGTAKLEPPREGDNVVICRWTAKFEIESDSKFFTAEIGGWTSSPQSLSDGEVSFHLDTVKEDPEFGSTAQIDPTWSTTE